MIKSNPIEIPQEQALRTIEAYELITEMGYKTSTTSFSRLLKKWYSAALNEQDYPVLCILVIDSRGRHLVIHKEQLKLWAMQKAVDQPADNEATQTTPQNYQINGKEEDQQNQFDQKAESIDVTTPELVIETSPNDELQEEDDIFNVPENAVAYGALMERHQSTIRTLQVSNEAKEIETTRLHKEKEELHKDFNQLTALNGALQLQISQLGETPITSLADITARTNNSSNKAKGRNVERESSDKGGFFSGLFSGHK